MCRVDPEDALLLGKTHLPRLFPAEDVLITVIYDTYRRSSRITSTLLSSFFIHTASSEQ